MQTRSMTRALQSTSEKNNSMLRSIKINFEKNLNLSQATTSSDKQHQYPKQQEWMKHKHQ